MARKNHGRCLRHAPDAQKMIAFKPDCLCLWRLTHTWHITLRWLKPPKPAYTPHGVQTHGVQINPLCIYIHTYIHTIYTYNLYIQFIHTIYTYHFYIHTYMHTCMHACMHACIHTYIHTYIHIHTYIQTHRQTDIHTYVRTYVRTYRHTDRQTYIHTYVRTYVHTYTYVCMCMHTVLSCLIRWGQGLDQRVFLRLTTMQHYSGTRLMVVVWCHL